MTYLRFVVAARDARSGHAQGVFTALYALERRGELAPYEVEWFRAAEEWFNEHLKAPTTLERSRGAPAGAITWLKASASEHVSRLRELVALLEHKDHAVDELQTEAPGYIVYEDEHQVAAVPFPSDRHTR